MLQDNREQNIKVLIRQFSNIKANKLEELYDNWKRRNSIEVVELEKDKTIQLYNDGKNVWQLNSSCNPDAAATVWAEQFDISEVNEHSIIFIFGMGDGRAVSEVAKRKGKCKILVYEPSLDIFWEAINRKEWTELLQLNNVFLFAEGINDEYFFHVIQQFLNYSNFQLVHLGVLPNYERIFQNNYIKFCQAIESAMELVIYMRNTELQRIEEITQNMYALSEDIIRQYSVKQVFEYVEKSGWQEIPAVLVAAGPSLDNCIEGLRAFGRKAFVLAVDTALNTLLDNGIVPNLTISVDSRKPLTLFKNSKFCNIPIVLSQQSNKEIVHMNKGIHLYEVDEEAYLNKIMIEETEKSGAQLPTGGSVANNGLSLLVQMGFKTIVLMGQDLAYPNMQLHTKDAYQDQKNEISLESRQYELIKDVHGNQVYTEKNMNLYRKWIELYIAGYPEIEFVNVSDCGAHIEGTKQLSIELCIERYGKNEINANNLLETLNPFFSKEEQEKLILRMQRIPIVVNSIEAEIEEALCVYGQMEDLYLKREFSNIKPLLEKVIKITAKIEETAESELIRAYMIEQHYSIQEKIYKYSENDTIEKQIWDMIIDGRELMDAYKEGIEKYRKEINSHPLA